MSLKEFISTNVPEPSLTTQILRNGMENARGIQLPRGFEWVYWDAAIRCVDCGITLTALAPTAEMVQAMYDEMAAEHRRRCPGDGA